MRAWTSAFAALLSGVLLGLHSGAALARPTAAPAPASPPGDAVRGKQLYQACQACHSVDEDDVGPRHRGVFGRRAASVAGYPYSAGLKASKLVWDRRTLDAWLAGPQQLVPGAKMYFSLSSPRDRADVIAYLEQLR